MNKMQLYVGMFIMATMVGFTSCSDDDDPSYSKTVMNNTALKTFLAQKGYQFNEMGNLLLDDLAMNTTKLDLSGTKIADFSELDILLNLMEVDLSDNGYGPIFDLSTLPSQITALNLSDNEIYDFEGLVDTKVVNDEVKTTILHPLTKLYLPQSAKWNVEDLMPFYTENKAKGTQVDMQMQDANGKLQAYNTLREIPDEAFRNCLKGIYPSLFPNNGTQIDIAKPMGLTEQGVAIFFVWGETKNAQSIEGIEYFINNPFYKSFSVFIFNESSYSISYIAPRSNIKAICLTNVETPVGVDFSKATNLARVQFSQNKYLTTLDLSNTVVGNQGIEELEISVLNAINITHCPNLKKIFLPKSNKGVVDDIVLADLPALESLDLSGIVAAQGFCLCLADCEITYPNVKYRFDTGAFKLVELEGSTETVDLAVNESVFNLQSTKDFINKYKNNLSDVYDSYGEYGAHRWSRSF